MTYYEVLRQTSKEFPHFQIVYKSKSPFMKFLSVLLFFNKGFMTDFITTIGNYMWVPDAWAEWRDCSKAAILRHERVHLRQQRRYGIIRYVFMYLLWPMPFFYAKGRRDLEMEAYEESMVAYAEYYGIQVLEGNVRENIIGHFTGSAYGWMWVQRTDIEEWYDTTVAKIVGE